MCVLRGTQQHPSQLSVVMIVRGDQDERKIPRKYVIFSAKRPIFHLSTDVLAEGASPSLAFH
jgi:hypothetical protein